MTAMTMTAATMAPSPITMAQPSRWSAPGTSMPDAAAHSTRLWQENGG